MRLLDNVSDPDKYRPAQGEASQLRAEGSEERISLRLSRLPYAQDRVTNSMSSNVGPQVDLHNTFDSQHLLMEPTARHSSTFGISVDNIVPTPPNSFRTTVGKRLHVQSTLVKRLLISKHRCRLGIAGLQKIVENNDESVLLIDGDGGELQFMPPVESETIYNIPAGDFTELEQRPDGKFVRTTTDLTAYEFDDDNNMAFIQDRNQNVPTSGTQSIMTLNRPTPLVQTGQPAGMSIADKRIDFSYNADNH